MSPFFLAQFRKSHQCRSCSARRKTARKFCEVHLAKARARWRNWRRDRQELGKCIQCNRNHIPGQQRCNPHRALNGEKCRVWYRLNKLRKSRYDRERKATWRAQGLCTRCGERQTTPDRVQCLDCRLHHQQFR